MFSSEECVICLDSPPTQVFHACMHVCTCLKCCGEVQKAKLHCPLCRQGIEYVSVVLDVAITPSKEELDAFRAYKPEYMGLLKKRCTENAGFVGKSKLARSVAREFGDEMEQRVKESAGGDRCMGKKFQFNLDADELKVEFKMGRRTIRESYQYVEDWKTELTEALAGDTISALDVAIHYPELYWAAKYQGRLDELTSIKRAAF